MYKIRLVKNYAAGAFRASKNLNEHSCVQSFQMIQVHRLLKGPSHCLIFEEKRKKSRRSIHDQILE